MNLDPMPDPRLAQLSRLSKDFRSGRISRRDFLDRLASLAGGAALAQHYFASSAWAQATESAAPVEAAASPAVESAAVLYPGNGATLLGYLSRPRPRDDGKSFPAVLLIHESTGLNGHIRDVARRLAAEGYFVLAVDQLSRHGGTASFLSPDDAAAACDNAGDEDIARGLEDLEAAASYLAFHPLVEAGRIAVLGFGWGGQRAFLYAAANPTLQAAVVFYGAPPPEDSLASIATPVLGHYAANDPRVTSTVAPTQAAMQRLGKSYDARIYPDTGHAFFNDTGPHYDEPAAQIAWFRTLEFLQKHLASG
jgi:carboxymethylenebutenolidase